MRRVIEPKAEESELAHRICKGADESYRMDETKKVMIGHASEMVKRRVINEILPMKGEEFMKFLKGGGTMRKMLRSIFDEELSRTPPPGTVRSPDDFGYTLKSS